MTTSHASDPSVAVVPPVALYQNEMTGRRSRPTRSPEWVRARQRESERNARGMNGENFADSYRKGFDFRGFFVSGVSLALVGATFLPFYSINSNQTNSITLTVTSHAFGSWRLLLFVVAGITALCGGANSWLRVGDRGAIAVFVALRILTGVQFAFWAAMLFVHHLGPISQPVGANPQVVITWFATGSVALAAVGLFGSLAAMGKHDVE